MNFSAPLASGRDADVFAIDADRVLRRYRDGGDVTAVARYLIQYNRDGGEWVRQQHRERRNGSGDHEED
jgi:hypothetical protein